MTKQEKLKFAFHWAATRAGCEAQCLQAEMPCTGRGGPCPNELEQGAAMMSALSSLLGSEDEKEEEIDAEELVGQIKAPVGTFYHYSLPHSAQIDRIAIGKMQY